MGPGAHGGGGQSCGRCGVVGVAERRAARGVPQRGSAEAVADRAY